MERDEYDDTYSINHFLFIILDEWNVEYYKIMLTPKFYDPSMIETVHGMRIAILAKNISLHSVRYIYYEMP